MKLVGSSISCIFISEYSLWKLRKIILSSIWISYGIRAKFLHFSSNTLYVATVWALGHWYCDHFVSPPPATTPPAFFRPNPIFQRPLRQRVTSHAPPLCPLHSHAPARDSSFRPPFGLSGVGSYFSGLIPEFPALSSALCGWLYALLSSQLSLVTCFCWVCCCFFLWLSFL